MTRRKQAEQALAESEDHYRHTVELNPQVPWTADPDGMILDASKRWESLTGLSVSDSLGTGWIRALHPDDVKSTSRVWTESLRTGRPLDVQYRIHRVDGTWRWMRARATARRGKNGEIIRWYGTVEDINDQRSTEEALRRSEARLKAVFDAVPVGIVIAEAPDGRVVMSNPRAEEILRSPEAAPAMIDDYCRESISFTPGPNSKFTRKIDHDQDHDHPLANAIMGGKSIGPTEYLRFHSDGSSAWISLTGAPVLDPDGRVSGGVVAIQDIDEDKREMQRLSDLNTVLKIKLEAHQ
ncbi:PAS domain-containing protein [Tunturiibacter gelidiferens]|uniref:PAS domain-containing protein n=1 Tax=Tunturiibacter gelidiferens TaxID=3069689 RepID=UPI003D9BCD31